MGDRQYNILRHHNACHVVCHFAFFFLAVPDSSQNFYEEVCEGMQRLKSSIICSFFFMRCWNIKIIVIKTDVPHAIFENFNVA